MIPNRWQGLNKLSRLVAPHRLNAACAVLLGVLAAMLEGFSIALLVPVLEGLIPGPEGSAGLVGRLTSWLGPVDSASRLRLAVTVILCAVVIKNLAAWMNLWLTAGLSSRARSDMVDRIFQQLVHVDYSYISRQKRGVFVDWLLNHTSRARRAIALTLRLISELCVVVIYALVLLVLNWRLTMLAVALVIALSLILRLLDRLLLNTGRDLSRSGRDVSTFLYEILGAMRELRLFGREKDEARRGGQVWGELISYERRLDVMSHTLVPLTESLIVLLLSVFLLVTAPNIVTGGAAVVPQLLVFLFVLMRLQRKVGSINSMRAELLTYVASVDIVVDAMSGKDKPRLQNGKEPFRELTEGIDFEHVTFAYGDGEELALQEVSFRVPCARMTALVGSSGAGKSTLADLLMRLDDPQKGRILASGRDLRDFDVSTWRSAIGVVTQDPFVFNASVRDNIRYSKPDATDQEIERAAKRANARAFIEALPEGYATALGDRGVRLSGGQRQRIAIARAILREPQLLILDEATSALDSESEQQVQKAIEDISQSCTLLVIAHRLSTVRSADQIVVLEKGRVIEIGTHQDLLERGGRYAELCRLQQHGLLSEKGPPGKPS